jgi:hypothetical protein
MFYGWCVAILFLIQDIPVGRDSSVGIATRYEMDGPGIESR